MLGALCCLLVVVPVGALLRMDRGSNAYRTLWTCMIVAVGAVCAATCVHVLSWPYYSQSSRSPANPGGPSGSPLFAVLYLLVIAGIVLPAFPLFLLLAVKPPIFLAPRKRHVLSSILVVFLLETASLTAWKYASYMADYSATTQR